MTNRILAVFGTLTLAAVAAWFFIPTEPATTAEAADPAEADAKSDWLTDMKKAQELAAKENKDLLINFTGSDWCSWCVKLKQEVFSKEEFEKAHKDFVLVEMDFPQDQSIVPPETRAQNEVWMNKFGIEGFPTLVLTDSKGRPYGSVGYVPGGPEAFLGELTKTQKSRELRDEKLAEAKSAAGLEKAKLIASALEAIPANYHLPMYREEVEQIIALDENDKGGLKSRFEKAVQEAEASERLQKFQEELQLAFQKGGADAALTLIEKELKAEKTLANPVLKKQLGQLEIQLLLRKGQELIGDEKTKEAEAIFETALKKTEKGEDEWLMVQVTRADLLKQAEQIKQAAAIYDEILTVKTLLPPQKAMVLIYAAEAHHEAKQDKETADRVAQADKLLAELGKDATIPPQLIDQLNQRLEAVRKGDAAEEKANEDGKEASDKKGE